MPAVDLFPCRSGTASIKKLDFTYGGYFSTIDLMRHLEQTHASDDTSIGAGPRTSPFAVDWDVPIEMSDGIVLRADVFRPAVPGR